MCTTSTRRFPTLTASHASMSLWSARPPHLTSTTPQPSRSQPSITTSGEILSIYVSSQPHFVTFQPHPIGFQPPFVAFSGGLLLILLMFGLISSVDDSPQHMVGRMLRGLPQPSDLLHVPFPQSCLRISVRNMRGRMPGFVSDISSSLSPFPPFLYFPSILLYFRSIWLSLTRFPLTCQVDA